MGRGACKAVGAAIALALTGCSGQPFAEGGGDGGHRPVSDASSEAAPDSDIPDGGKPSSAGTIGCGTTTCTVANSVCCGAPGMPSCIGRGGACAGLTFACDEAANCPATAVCCFDPVNGASCMLSCGGGLQLCRTNAECPNRDCTVNRCMNGGQIETCGAMTMVLPVCM